MSRAITARVSSKLGNTPFTRSGVAWKSVVSRWFSFQNKSVMPLRPVVIVGGGPTGLAMSCLLSKYNVESVLLEARQECDLQKHPQAHYLNIRTMEILRHYLPAVYSDVQQQTPPIHTWEKFTFRHDLNSQPMATVQHPVQNICNYEDGNGKLLQNELGLNNNCNQTGVHNTSQNNESISVCRPAHLAQHKYVSILLNHAEQMASRASSQLHFNSPVQRIEQHHDENSFNVYTKSGEVYNAQYVVAANGSASNLRQNTKMLGEPEIQHLINVYFKINCPKLQSTLPDGMLHFCYNSQVVAALVCHNDKDWVMQIPFFPPHQQIDTCFNHSRVQHMISACIFGSTETKISFDKNDIEIVSVRPWKMGATVSESYLTHSTDNTKQVILAGDAAHVFPPAGGFGLNTGLQDAHALAWRLAYIIKHTNGKYTHLLTQYSEERQAIAAQNAALSVRNYQRTLNLAKACFLDAQHPTLLDQALKYTPFLSGSTKANIFQTAYQTALLPLSNLKNFNHNFIGQGIARRIQKILSEGGGLPLIFPRYEVGFSYQHEQTENDDTAGYEPEIIEGKRLPHLQLKILNTWGGAKVKPNFYMKDCDDRTVTLTDIQSQIHVAKDVLPRWTILISSPFSEFESFMSCLMKQSEDNVTSPIQIAYIVHDSKHQECKKELYQDCLIPIILLLDKHNELQSLITQKMIRKLQLKNEKSTLILIRPDGHVTNIFHQEKELFDFKKMYRTTSNCIECIK